MQEAFLKIWKVREDVDLETVEPLLYRTALNLASNRRRSSRLWRWIGIDAASDEASPAPTSEEALATAQNRQRVRVAIEALPERLREVILLTEYSELTHQEIGSALGIPSGTVGSRRNAAIAQLSERLEPPPGGIAKLRERMTATARPSSLTARRLVPVAATLAIAAAVLVFVFWSRNKTPDLIAAARHRAEPEQVALGLAPASGGSAALTSEERATTALAEVHTTNPTVAFYWVSSTE